MIILTPTDLATYLISIAAQHPLVRDVVYGEHSRVESATLSTSRYPQVDIETAAARIPVHQGPAQLATRIYVLSSTPGGLNADEDLTHDTTYAIARDLVNIIIAHTDDGTIDVELTDAEIKITPIVASGSDQQRGWMFSIEFNVDNHQCTEDLNVDALVIPQFTYEVEDDYLTVTDITHGLDVEALTETWYWALGDTEAGLFEPPGLDLREIDHDSYPIHLWLKAAHGMITQWSYAYVPPGDRAAGRSTPFVPRLPE